MALKNTHSNYTDDDHGAAVGAIIKLVSVVQWARLGPVEGEVEQVYS